ncbi:MAG TPA: hypothetical protein VH117_03505 [Edaphobacter sp.]|nr:hypothetical protein [Edaphobacter sp.]
MFIERALKRPAILCVLLLALCTLASYPFVEMGQCDDFAYVRSAKTLAETGHIIYYGWASAMLGWQLALGALFIKIFGFSFSATYASVLLVALATAFLLQRTFVLLGLRETNAAFATLTLVLSPLFLPLSFSFMSDIPGLFAIVVCLYFCVRAVRSPLPSQTETWLIAACISSALLGTVRQTSWLGLFVMVPTAWWLVRQRRPPVLGLAVIWSVCTAFVFGCLYWFSRQMYSTVESFSQVHTDGGHFFNAVVLAICVLLDAAFFLAPILIAFIFQFVKQNKRLVYIALAGVLIFCSYFMIRPNSYWVGILLAPALKTPGNYVTFRGVVDLGDIGLRPVVLEPPVRVIITVVCYFAAFAFSVVLLTSLLFTRNRRAPTPPLEAQPSQLSLQQIIILLGPFTLAYCVFLSFRIFSGVLFDRYLLPVFIVLAVVAMRFYQDRVNPRLPRTCYAVLLLGAAYSVAATHDEFVADRARLAAIKQFQAAGLPRTAFYGGFPYDGWTQIDARGYVDSDGIRTPDGVSRYSRSRSQFMPCGYFHAKYYSAIKPQYLLSYDNFSCGDPQTRFAPVTYRLWLPPFSGAIYTRSLNLERFLRAEK